MNQVKEFLEYVFNVFKFWVIIQPWEQGLRVRNGKHIKKISRGLFFKIPYLDSIYVQEFRLRMIPLSMQTLTTKDGMTVTINSSLGYQISDLMKLYNTICHPGETISALAMSEVSDYIFTHDLKDITPKKIEDSVLSKLRSKDCDFGLEFKNYRITNFACVKTFRLIQDGQSWCSDGFEMTKKK